MRHITRHPKRVLTFIIACAAMLGTAATLTACSNTQATASSSQSQLSGDQDVQKELKKLNTLMDKAFILKSDTTADKLNDPKTLTELETYYRSIDPNKLKTVKQIKQTETRLTAVMKKVQGSLKR